MLGPHAGELSDVRTEIEGLIVVAREDEDEARRREALEALVYLADPYDLQFDFFDGIGFDDDKTELRRAWRRIAERAWSPA